MHWMFSFQQDIRIALPKIILSKFKVWFSELQTDIYRYQIYVSHHGLAWSQIDL